MILKKKSESRLLLVHSHGVYILVVDWEEATQIPSPAIVREDEERFS